MTTENSVLPFDKPAELTEQEQQNNIWRLAIAQALAGANSVVIFAAGAIVGNNLAPSAMLATLPISIFVVGMAACVFPAGEIARLFGRRIAFLVGSGAGVLTGLFAMLAVFMGWFWLFCAATFLGGAYAAVVLSFRFAATDGVSAKRQPQALSLVMAGGVLAGVIGPQLITYTMHLWPGHTFVATFLTQAVVAAIAAVILWSVKLPELVTVKNNTGRALTEIIRQPKFIGAVICGAASYTIMNFLMTAAPLAMHIHGHSQEAANLGIQWHVIAMYAPSFFTGKLISRFGAIGIAGAGILLTGVSAIIGLEGTDVTHFWWMLILLGVGWNFGFLGASALVLQCHRPEEKTRVQSLNDFIIFGLMAIGSFLSGGILATYGWNFVLWVSFGPLLVAILTLGLILKGKS
ncbi:MFS transporter [Catenovulum sp. 2E275]|uniref:MFS transporter n=1 Tax=Catenovulum sp. 2E275 TaxID=2980497 RepID=UPI0021D268CB|nr:MFS transporter [Catenovulum sp. 2E275]MCU4676557.1 MFS transporter [Catenovulum sp. 2E275]